MSIGRDIDDGAYQGASQLLARAAAAMSRADRGLAAAIDDFFVPDDARLDDRTRATLAATLQAIVALVENDLRLHAARSLTSAGDDDGARRVAEGVPVTDRLIAANLLRDPALMRELIGRTRQDLLADGFPTSAPDEGAGSSLLARLSASADALVAKAALDLMAADGRRRSGPDRSELPAELHHRLVWWVAAAIGEQAGVDRALGEAALRAFGEHDEGDSVEGAAMRLAAAIDPQPSELPMLLTHALGDRAVSFFAALLARSLRIDFADARDLVVRGGDPLWLGLRAIDLDRATIARVGLALGGDVEAFADQLDAIMTISPGQARAALAPLALHPDFRAAAAALAATR